MGVNVQEWLVFSYAIIVRGVSGFRHSYLGGCSVGMPSLRTSEDGWVVVLIFGVHPAHALVTRERRKRAESPVEMAGGWWPALLPTDYVQGL